MENWWTASRANHFLASECCLKKQLVHRSFPKVLSQYSFDALHKTHFINKINFPAANGGPNSGHVSTIINYYLSSYTDRKMKKAVTQSTDIIETTNIGARTLNTYFISSALRESVAWRCANTRSPLVTALVTTVSNKPLIVLCLRIIMQPANNI